MFAHGLALREMLQALLAKRQAQQAARLAAELGHGHVEVDGRLLLAGHHRRRALPQAHEVQAARGVLRAVLPQRPHRLHRQKGFQVFILGLGTGAHALQDCLGKKIKVDKYQPHTLGYRNLNLNVVFKPRSLHMTVRRKRALGHGRTSTKSSTRKTSWRRRECTQPSHARKSSSLLAHTSICAEHDAQRSRMCLLIRACLDTTHQSGKDNQICRLARVICWHIAALASADPKRRRDVCMWHTVAPADSS